MSDSKTHEIVVLGANFGGAAISHYLLRHTIPALQKLDSTRAYHITVVTPNTDWLFKPGTPRVLIAPELLPEEKVWRPLSDIFKRYPADQITLVYGFATALDPTKKTINVKLNSSGEQTITYDSVVLSTGTTSANPAYGLHNDQSLTSKTWKSTHGALPKVKTVLVAGGGAVGVETAGEIGSAFPSIDITILSGSSRLLERIIPKLGARAEEYLKTNFGAKVVHNVRVTATSGDGPTTVTLSDGSTKTYDLYLDCTGGKPNTNFLPKSWLDKSGRVIKKDNYFRARGGESSNDAKDVYIVGDLLAGGEDNIFQLEAMVPCVGTAIGQDIASKIGKAGKAPPLREYKPMEGVIQVPIGPNGGVGMIMGWAVPSWVVKTIKAKSFLIDLLEPYAFGDKWKKA